MKRITLALTLSLFLFYLSAAPARSDDLAPDSPKSDSTAPVELGAVDAPAATAETGPGASPAASPAAVATEISNATVTIKQLPVPITEISGKARWVAKGTEVSDVKFRILDSRFSASGFIGKSDAPHDFKVVSDSVKFDDLKKIYPILGGFRMSGDFKFGCRVSGRQDDPSLAGEVSLPSSTFDFGELLPDLKGISISNVRSGFSYSKERYEIRDFSFGTMNGTVTLGGVFAPKSRGSASLSVSVAGLDASQLARFSPRLKGKMTGSFGADFRISGFGAGEGPSAEGTLYFRDGVISDLEALKKIGDKIKVPDISELRYSKIGGRFKLYRNQRVDFTDFEVVSDILKLRTTGTIDETKKISARATVEIAGEKLGGKMGTGKLGKILGKIARNISAKFNVSGTTEEPKFELDTGI